MPAVTDSGAPPMIAMTEVSKQKVNWKRSVISLGLTKLELASQNQAQTGNDPVYKNAVDLYEALSSEASKEKEGEESVRAERANRF